MYMSTKEYAHEMGMNTESVRRLCASGQIDAIRVGSVWRIPLDTESEKVQALEDRVSVLETFVDALMETIGGGK